MSLTSRKTSSGARDVVQLVECLPWHAQNPLFNAQDYIKLDMVIDTYNLCAREVETGGSGLQSSLATKKSLKPD